MEFDHLLDSLDLVLDGNNIQDKEFSFFESCVNFSLDDAENYGTNTIIVVYDFKPQQLSKLKNRSKIIIYCLVPLQITREILNNTLIDFSKSYDWPSNATNEDIERNIGEILSRKELLINECNKYNIKIVDTSFYEERDLRINNLINEIVNDYKW